MQIPTNISRTDYNPWLWVDADTLGTDNPAYYIAANANQLNARNWYRVNQFGSILAVFWLQNPRNPGTTFGFPDLPVENQQSAAQILIGFDSMQARVQYAVQQLSGQQMTLSQLNPQLRGYLPGTQIWFGNDIHVQAAIVGKNGTLNIYDPNSGDTRELGESEFLIVLGNLGVDSIVVHTA